jgi:hypothetical protein
VGVAFHYSESNTGGAAIVRAIQNYRMDSRGDRDMCYNALVDTQGNAYEGRQGGWLAVASHALNQNTPYIGICFIGRNVDVTPAALDTMRRLYLDLCALKGSSLLAKGHRDLPGQSTDCPGSEIEAWLSQGMPWKSGVDDMGVQITSANVQQALKDAGFLVGTDVDDDWGPNSQSSLTNTFKAIKSGGVVAVPAHTHEFAVTGETDGVKE